MDDKQLLAKFAAAALKGVAACPYSREIGRYGVRVSSKEPKGLALISMDIAQAMLAEFKQRTEQKGNGEMDMDTMRDKLQGNPYHD